MPELSDSIQKWPRHASLFGAAPFSSADLPTLPDGRVYHLRLSPTEIAADILLVGDPGRSEFIGKRYLRDIEVDVENRGLRSVTGISQVTGDRVSVITSGMGTPSLEIVLEEIGILKQVDLTNRRYVGLSEPVQIIRVGTSGALQVDTPLGTSIISRYAVGLDNTGLFYESPFHDEACDAMEQQLHELIKRSTPTDSRAYGKIFPYVSKSDETLCCFLIQSAQELGVPFKPGITVTNSGFFASQGRNVLPPPPSIPDLDLVVAEYHCAYDNVRVENMEMESSALFHIGRGLGFRTASVCPTVAHRRLETFATDHERDIANAVEIALHSLKLGRAAFHNRRFP